MVDELLHEKQEAARCCEVLGVSRSGYYDWQTRPESNRSLEDQRLWEKIKLYWERSRKTYGSPRIVDDLRDDGETCGVKRVARIMKQNGISGAGKKKFKVVTTDSNHDLPIAERIFESENHAELVTEPNQYWGADITYVRTNEGWLYLAIVLDLFTRKVVGHSMRPNMESELVVSAMEMALGRQKPETSLTAHSDRGSQYAGQDYRAKLAKSGITASMSRRGNCYDNAFVESFFRTLKVELIYRTEFKTREEAKRAIFEFIEVWYNRQRKHSSLDYQTPEEYESKSINKVA
jgi:transposase InsO family protein